MRIPFLIAEALHPPQDRLTSSSNVTLIQYYRASNLYSLGYLYALSDHTPTTTPTPTTTLISHTFPKQPAHLLLKPPIPLPTKTEPIQSIPRRRSPTYRLPLSAKCTTAPLCCDWRGDIRTLSIQHGDSGNDRSTTVQLCLSSAGAQHGRRELPRGPQCRAWEDPAP